MHMTPQDTPEDGECSMSRLYCHWDTHAENVPFNSELELDHHLKNHLHSTTGEDPFKTVACHWDACHETFSMDHIMDHLYNSHWKDTSQPHNACRLSLDRATEFVDFGPCGSLQTVQEGQTELPVESELQAYPPVVPQVSPVPYVEVHSCQTPQHTPLSELSIPRLDSAPIPEQPAGPFACQWLVDGTPCNQLYSTTHDLNHHIAQAHVGHGKSDYVCMWAGCQRQCEPFKQRQRIVRHLQVHAKNFEFKCPECGKLFNDEAALRQHRRRHSGEKPHECKICGKRFAVGTGLTMHMRTHTGEKPLCCSFPGCGKQFSESSNLAKHMRTHMDKVFKCDYCMRRFTRADQLRRHIHVSHAAEARARSATPAPAPTAPAAPMQPYPPATVWPV